MKVDKIEEEDYDDDFPALAVQSDEGQILIGDDVLSRIVEIAVSEVEGTSLETRFHLSSLISRKERDASSSIQVNRKEGEKGVTISISVKMEFGEDMYELAIRLRNHIKNTVEKMTRVTVTKVDIKIVGIAIKEKHEAEENAEDSED